MKAVVRLGASGVLFLFFASAAVAQIEIFKEDFEGAFPGTKWTVGDFISSSGLDYWGRSSHRSYSGSYSGWCAQVGDSAGISNSSRHRYDLYMDAYAYFRVDLSVATSASTSSRSKSTVVFLFIYPPNSQTEVCAG